MNDFFSFFFIFTFEMVVENNSKKNYYIDTLF